MAVGLDLALLAPPIGAQDRGSPVVGALREALQLAVERGVASVARQDGFMANPNIRLDVPEQLGKVESALRLAGQERVTDKFVESMNRAAELAAPAARAPLIVGASEVYLEERMLGAGETVLTDALKRHALGRALAALTPAVAEATDRAGTARRYKRFVKGAHFGGLVQQAPVDLDAYVVGRTGEGIFYAIGQEERRIRSDATARPTARLREVFAPHR